MTGTVRFPVQRSDYATCLLGEALIEQRRIDLAVETSAKFRRKSHDHGQWPVMQANAFD